MKNKKKLALFAIALTVVVSLVVGGTLMLWSAMSDEATNIVTMDSADIVLRESGGFIYRDYDNSNVYKPVYAHPKLEEISAWEDENNKIAKIDENRPVQGDFTGFDWSLGEARPGDVLLKAPDVENMGSIPLYIKVDGVFELRVPDQDDLTAWDEKYLEAFLDSSMLLGYNDENWDGIPLRFELAKDNGKTIGLDIYGTWFYAEGGTGGAYGTLKPLDPGYSTEDIFKAIYIPIEMPNAFQNFTFSLKFKAYGIQSDNIFVDPTAPKPQTWIDLFPKDDENEQYGSWGITELNGTNEDGSEYSIQAAMWDKVVLPTAVSDIDWSTIIGD